MTNKFHDYQKGVFSVTMRSYPLLFGDILCYFNFSDPPTRKVSTSSVGESWIGQKVTLKCVPDGVPTPTLTWYKPDGSPINSVTAKQSRVNVKMNVDQDFGARGYKCVADNGLLTDFKIVKIDQISKLFFSVVVSKWPVM